MLMVDLYFIPGVMVGIELPPAQEFGPEIAFTMVMDLLIFRVVLSWVKDGNHT